MAASSRANLRVLSTWPFPRAEHGDVTIFIAGISSHIGGELAKLYSARSQRVVGTYRNAAHVESMRDQPNVELISCDVSQPGSIRAAADRLEALAKPWDIFIGAVGQLDPIGPFLKSDMDEWAASLSLNSVGQLRLLHAIYPLRARAGTAKVAFLVGGGINGPFRNYSAYCLGKVMLVKACELLHDEAPDVHAVAIGTGWVDTKIHRQTLDAGARAGANYERTRDFLAANEKGTSHSDILACIDWCFAQDRATTGGRNFSVVHDGWREDTGLAASLLREGDKYKLRRSGN
jgi:NAD(P)-dependent dehydrogenase (short-subunit alcohol dehydrogenase family)